MKANEYIKNEINLTIKTETVESKCRTITAPKYIIHIYPFIYIEKLIRWIIRKPVPRKPVKYTLENCECIHIYNPKDIEKAIIESIENEK